MLCFRKFPVAKKNMDKGEGEVSRFPSKIFCLTVSKRAVGEPFSLSSISGIKKVWMREWGGGSVKFFRRKFFVSKSQKISYGNPLCCISENFWSRKCLWIRGRGKYEDFLSKNFCHTVP